MINRWRQAAVKDRDELEIKIAKLVAFLDSDESKIMDSVDRDLLTIQINYMRRYMNILIMRLEK